MRDCLMRDCPVCAQLRLEYGSAAQQEAKATLEQRTFCFHTGNVERNRYDTLERAIQESRRRQAQLAHILDRHRAEHPAA